MLEAIFLSIMVSKCSKAIAFIEVVLCIPVTVYLKVVVTSWRRNIVAGEMLPKLTRNRVDLF